MKEIILEKICENESRFDRYYKFIDLKKFGEKEGKIIELFDYQQDALKNVMNCLNLYYQDREDFYKKYRFNGLDAELEEKVSINKAEDNSSFDILENHYKTEGDKLEFKSICNRASFWMATGSGKTLVMIKLIEILFELSKLPKETGGIPKNDILILAPRPKILNQIKEHIEDFNRKNDLQIELRDLREWEYCKRNSPNLYSENTVTVFYYRSDNLKESGYDTENETNYQNYLHGTDSDGYKFGSWYVILDEAHKGVTGDSKRQNIYQVLAKEGFLFNFSATFTDAIDKATTVFNFNLERFVNSGYGKHIKVTNQEFRSFNKKREDEFTNKEKRKIVLKSLITLAAIKKAKKKIWESIPLGKETKPFLYHNPLLITIANTIQTTEADLKLFFRELAKIAKEEIDIEEAKGELILEWREPENRIFQFNSGKISDKFISLLSSITYNDIKKFVFNTSGSGSIEIINIEGNQRELAFKMSTANSKPFALLVASDATNWMKDLDNYTASTDVIAESFFDRLNEPENEINILLGKQIFAEGWDSNRPNVINFINIGVSDAQKFVLQAMGRGIRIEPFKGIRKRFDHIVDKDKYLSIEEVEKIEPLTQGLETVFIFSTNKETIGAILKNIETNETRDEWIKVDGINKTGIKEDLPIPEYELDVIYNENKFKISKEDFDSVNELISTAGERVLIAANSFNIKTLKKLKDEKNFNNNFEAGTTYNLAAEKVITLADFHFTLKPKRLSGFRKVIDGDITHFQKIKAKSFNEVEIKELREHIEKIIEEKYKNKEELVALLQEGKIDDTQFALEFGLLVKRDEGAASNKIPLINRKFLKEHYYNPVLIATNDSKEYFRNIIKEDSEVEFFNDLVEYFEKPDNKLKDYDWWYFSKLVENVDEIKIPYFNKEKGKFADFNPDFIFWLKKGDKYFIKFVDPKGRLLALQNSLYKVQGFEKIFDNKAYSFNKKKLEVELHLYNPTGEVHFAELKDYYKNRVEDLFKD